MKLPNNGGGRVPTDCLLLPNKAFSSGIRLQLLELLPMGHFRNPQTTQVGAKTIGFFLQTDSKGPRLKTAPTQLIERGDMEPVPTQSLHHYVVAFW